MQHHAVLDDALYVVVRNGGKDVLQKFSLKIDDGEREITDNQGTTTDTTDDVTYWFQAMKSSGVTGTFYSDQNNHTLLVQEIQV